jgi:hypothetical protein
LTEPVKKRSRGKTYETSKEGRITVFPKLRETKERATFRLVMRLLKRLRKGH